MYKNNFDMNSKGLSLQCNIYYDEIMGQSDFDINFTKLGDDILLFIDDSNIEFDSIEEDYEKFYDIKVPQESLDNYNLEVHEELDYMDKDELIYEFIYEHLKNDFDYEEFEKELDANNIEYKRKFEITDVWYQQGYKYEVIYFEFENSNINYNDYFTQLITECPIYGNIEINNEEFFVSDYLPDNYCYDKDILIKFLLDDKNIIEKYDIELLKTELINLLPEELNYAI